MVAGGFGFKIMARRLQVCCDMRELTCGDIRHLSWMDILHYLTWIHSTANDIFLEYLMYTSADDTSLPEFMERETGAAIQAKGCHFVEGVTFVAVYIYIYIWGL